MTSRENDLCMETPILVPRGRAPFGQLTKRSAASGDENGRRHAGARKPTETSVTEFCWKSFNLSLEGLKNIKIVLFLVQELLRQPNSLK